MRGSRVDVAVVGSGVVHGRCVADGDGGGDGGACARVGLVAARGRNGQLNDASTVVLANEEGSYVDSGGSVNSVFAYVRGSSVEEHIGSQGSSPLGISPTGLGPDYRITLLTFPDDLGAVRFASTAGIAFKNCTVFARDFSVSEFYSLAFLVFAQDNS